MTLPELQALTKYWKRSPPVHVSVAAYLGIGSASDKQSAREEPNVGELTALAGPPLAKFRPPARMN